MRHTAALCCAAVAAGLAAPARAAPPKAAVLPVVGEQLEAKQADGLTQLIATELARTGRFQVVTQADLTSLIDLQTRQQILGCEGDACVQTWRDVGAALDVDRVVAASTSTVDGAALLSVRVIDPKGGAVIGRGGAPLPSGLEATLQAVRAALLAALGYSGRIVLWNQPAGSLIFLEGQLVGTAPVPPIDVEKPGTYTVQSFHDDYSPWERKVEVAAGAAVRVKVDAEALVALEQQAANRDLWGYGALAAAGVSGGIAAVLWGLAGVAQQQYDDADFRGQPLSAQQPYTDTILTRTVAAGVLSGVAAGAATAGLVLLLHNPARARLDELGALGGVAAVLTPGGAMGVWSLAW